MKKTAIMLMAALLACASAMAQYGTDKVRLSFPVHNMPAFYSGEHVYHVVFEASHTVSMFADYDMVCDMLSIGEDWQENRESASVPAIITLRASDFIIEGYHEDIVEERVLRHGEYVMERFFLPRIDYSIRLERCYSCGSEATGWYTNLVDGRPPIHSFVIDKRFRDPRECQIFARENREEFSDKIIGKEIADVAAAMRDEMRGLYLYYPTTDNIKICLFDSKKSPYYAKHQEAKAELIRIMSGIQLDGSLSQAIKEMQPWISHFKELEESLQMSDKKQKGAKADMVYNLAMIYYALEVFDVSRDYCKRLYNEFGDNAGKRMLRNISDVEEQLRQHHLQSRHF